MKALKDAELRLKSRIENEEAAMKADGDKFEEIKKEAEALYSSIVSKKLIVDGMKEALKEMSSDVSVDEVAG